LEGVERDALPVEQAGDHSHAEFLGTAKRLGLRVGHQKDLVATLLKASQFGDYPVFLTAPASRAFGVQNAPGAALGAGGR